MYRILGPWGWVVEPPPPKRRQCHLCMVSYWVTIELTVFLFSSHWDIRIIRVPQRSNWCVGDVFKVLLLASFNVFLSVQACSSETAHQNNMGDFWYLFLYNQVSLEFSSLKFLYFLENEDEKKKLGNCEWRHEIILFLV